MGASPGGRDAPLDLFAQAEQLNEVSRAYEVEIDGVPLQQMTTAELTKLTASRGLPMSRARGELIAALAKDEADRARRRSGDSGEADRGVVPGAGDFEEFNPSDEGRDPADPDSYLVGATCVVWEGELYTYGGLTPEGEFVESILRWSGRGQTTEVHASPANPKIGIPPGRYGHSAVVVDDALYVFGGQGQFGCLDDLWRFDFETCAWTLVDVVGAPPSVRTGHCACVSDDVMFIFGGRDVRPGQDVVTYNDLYGFDLREREWLTIDTRWRRPAGGDGCAMTSVNGVLYVLSPSDTCMEMLVWCLQLSAKGVLRWTQVPRSGQVPSPRVDYAAATHGANWIVHGGRVLLRDGVLGDTYAFHFPTGEWGKFDPESDTDPRFGHCGATVDGALVLLHGKRDPASVDPESSVVLDAGECVAVDLGSYLMFPEHDETRAEYDFDAHEHGHLSTVEEQRAAAARAEAGAEATGADREGSGVDAEIDPELAAFEAEGFPKMNAKLLGKLNKRGIGGKGGLMGGSLHVGRKGSHAPGDVEFVSGNVKLHAHRDVVAGASPGLARLMATRPIVGALNRQPDLVEYAFKVHPVIGQLLGMFVHLAHVVAVALTFGARAATVTGADARRVTLVFEDTPVPVLVAMLRWMYRIPLHPPRESLVELHDAGVKYEVKGLSAYCQQRMRTEMCAELAAGAARVAKERHVSGLWKVAVRCAQREWDAVRYSTGMERLARSHPDVAKEFTLAVHDTISVEE